MQEIQPTTENNFPDEANGSACPIPQNPAPETEQEVSSPVCYANAPELRDEYREEAEPPVAVPRPFPIAGGLL